MVVGIVGGVAILLCACVLYMRSRRKVGHD
jgi:hypothetical protein